MSYSIASSSSIDLDTITITNGGYNIASGTGSTWVTSATGSSYTISTGAGAGFIAQSLADLDPVTFKWKNEEFVDCFPDFDRIQAMCKEYPGLKIAYEKFVTTYRLVKDDYDTPKDKK